MPPPNHDRLGGIVTQGSRPVCPRLFDDFPCQLLGDPLGLLAAALLTWQQQKLAPLFGLQLSDGQAAPLSYLDPDLRKRATPLYDKLRQVVDPFEKLPHGLFQTGAAAVIMGAIPDEPTGKFVQGQAGSETAINSE